MLDQALFLNTNRFKDCRWVERYNRTAESYCMWNSNENPAQFWFNTLKIDQVLPVSIFCSPIVGRKGRVRTTHAHKIT